MFVISTSVVARRRAKTCCAASRLKSNTIARLLRLRLRNGDLTETKSPSNPLGIKGCGEAGAIAAPAAVINAITDAIGTENLAMPATANAVWSALQGAKPRQAA